MTPFVDRGEPPYVIFICQDEDQRERFVRAADHELTGHHWHPGWAQEANHYVGRRRVVFAVEQNAHRGQLEAWRLPAFPPEHPKRTPKVDCVRLALRREGESSVGARTVHESESELGRDSFERLEVGG